MDFELLSSSVDVESNPQMKEELEKLRKLTETMRESDTDNVSRRFLCYGWGQCMQVLYYHDCMLSIWTQSLKWSDFICCCTFFFPLSLFSGDWFFFPHQSVFCFFITEFEMWNKKKRVVFYFLKKKVGGRANISNARLFYFSLSECVFVWVHCLG